MLTNYDAEPIGVLDRFEFVGGNPFYVSDLL